MTEARIDENTTRTVRLLWRSSPRGIYRIAMELPAGRMAECAEWAKLAYSFCPTVEFRFEETSGRWIRDFFRGLMP